MHRRARKKRCTYRWPLQPADHVLSHEVSLEVLRGRCSCARRTMIREEIQPSISPAWEQLQQHAHGDPVAYRGQPMPSQTAVWLSKPLTDQPSRTRARAVSLHATRPKTYEGSPTLDKSRDARVQNMCANLRSHHGQSPHVDVDDDGDGCINKETRFPMVPLLLAHIFLISS